MLVEIVETLKERTTALFEGRVSAAGEFALLETDAHMDLPAAYVLPLDDNAQPNKSDNGYKQLISDAFAVVVVLDNAAKELSVSSVAQVQQIRNELIKQLVSWAPDAEHGPIEYGGGEILALNRAHLYYQFEFSANTEISEGDTYQAIANGALGELNKVGVEVDLTDPSLTGEPDGVIEAAVEFDIDQT